MRVLQIGKFYPPARGGIETVLRGIVEGLAARGDLELEVLVFNQTPETVTEVHGSVPVTRLARWEQLFSVPIAPSMVPWLRSRRYDLIHLHEPNPLAALSVLLTRPSPHLVVSYHSDVVRQRLLLRLYQPLQRRILNRADRIIVSSERLVDCSVVLPRYKERCRVVPFGIDPRPYQDPDAATLGEVERIRGLVGGRPFVLFAGRLVYYKGLQFLMEAVRALDVPLVVAGDGPAYATLRLLATGMEDRTFFLGDVSDAVLRACMLACRVLVLPSVSSSETFGLVQLEAMAAGKPVVNTSLATGVPTVSLHEVTGLTVPPGDAGALAEALGRLMASEELCLAMGRRGRERVAERYTLERQAEGIMGVYREALGQGGGAS